MTDVGEMPVRVEGPISYRLAVNGDINDIAAVWHEGYQEVHGCAPKELRQQRTLEHLCNRIPAMLNNTYVAIGCLADSMNKIMPEDSCSKPQLLGFVSVKAPDELYQLYVVKAARSKYGVSPELMRLAEMHLCKFSRESVMGCLYVSVENAHAVRFYTRCGWKISKDEMYQADIWVKSGVVIKKIPFHCFRMEKELKIC